MSLPYHERPWKVLERGDGDSIALASKRLSCSDDDRTTMLEKRAPLSEDLPPSQIIEHGLLSGSDLLVCAAFDRTPHALLESDIPIIVKRSLDAYRSFDERPLRSALKERARLVLSRTIAESTYDHLEPDTMFTVYVPSPLSRGTVRLESAAGLEKMGLLFGLRPCGMDRLWADMSLHCEAVGDTRNEQTKRIARVTVRPLHFSFPAPVDPIAVMRDVAVLEETLARANR